MVCRMLRAQWLKLELIRVSSFGLGEKKIERFIWSQFFAELWASKHVCSPGD